MIFFKVPDLKQLCLIKTATSLFTPNHLRYIEEDIKTIMNCFSPPLKKLQFFTEKGLRPVEIKLQEKLSQLQLPEKLMNEVLNYIKPIVDELLAWIRLNHFQFKCRKMVPEKIFWTSQGTIDKQKTVAGLMADESLSVFARYKLACLYCLEDFICFFGSKLNHRDRIINRNNKCYNIFSYGFSVSALKDLTDDYSLTLAFEESAECGNETACRYFMEKLNEEGQTTSLLATAHQILKKSSYERHKIIKNPYHDVLRFLFIHMNEEERTALWKDNLKKEELWSCFLNSQWQSSCLEICDLASDYSFGDDDVYTHLLTLSVLQINKGYRDYNYSELCRKLWDRSPPSCKTYVINEFKTRGRNVWFWEGLLKAEDEITIAHLLKMTSAEEKMEIFLSNRLLFGSLIMMNDRWDFLKFLSRVLEVPKDMLAEWKDGLYDCYDKQGIMMHSLQF